MGLLSNGKEALRVLGEFAQIAPKLAGMKMPDMEAKISLGAMFEDSVERYPDNIMLLFEGRQWTYAEFNAEVNRLAHFMESRGIERGDTVALFMENRAEFILSVLALVKLGATASLINNSLSGSALVHCFTVTKARACIVGEERAAVLAEVLKELEIEAGRDCYYFKDSSETAAPDWAVDLGEGMAGMPDSNPPVTRDITGGEVALYIFTSGTTGLPKAAIMLHRKIHLTALGLGQIGFRVKPTDRLYLCLPVYHLTGLGPGLCSFIGGGGSIFLRRSFSASNFWKEVQEHQTNSFIYVGELCRYLSSAEPCEEERNNPLVKMAGNGLRPDIWDEFKGRFGVERICELYGSSEGNVSFLNILNKDKTIGASFTPVALLKYDIENDEIIRDEAGFCREVPIGEPGLLVSLINEDYAFEGYTNADATKSKIISDVKTRGDHWFNTGDLIRRVDVGFSMGLKHYQFVDRTGDTFRWRAENVSTNEVAEAINMHPQIDMANVYGVEVPGTEGRAGMVAFEMDEATEFDLQAFQTLVEEKLPAYAQPVFIRLLRSAETTVTFKLLKGELRQQAYHPDKVGSDVIYVRKPRSAAYELLDTEFYQQMMDANSGY